MKFKAAVLYKHKKPLIIREDLIIPKLEDNQILVKLAFTGICKSQIMEIDGKRGFDKYLPHLLGHEGVGTIVDKGRKISKVKINNRVVVSWIKGKGLDGGGMKYKCSNGDIINAGPVCTFAEFCIIPENRCVKIPKYIESNIAPLFGCALPTGAGIFLNQLKDIPKDSIIGIFGIGGIGLSSYRMAKALKFKKVILVDIEEHKLKQLKKEGAWHTINVSKQDAYAIIMKITKNYGLDYAIESTGTVDVISKAFECVKKFGGKCIFASHPEFGKKIKLDPFDLISGKQIFGSWGGDVYLDKDIPKLTKLVKEKKLNLANFTSKPFSLCEINKAISLLKKRKVNRAIVKL